MIIFRYLAREVMLSMIAVSGVLLLIIMSGRFVKYLAEAAAGKLDPDVLFAVMAYRIPGFLELILPLGLFIGFLLAYGRLYMDSEITVLSACGMSQRRLVGYSMLPAGLVAALVAVLSLVVSPLGIERANKVLESQKLRSEFEHLSPARFQSTGAGSNVTYAEKITDNRKIMRQVFMAEMSESQAREGSEADNEPVELAVITAKTGEQIIDPSSGQRYLKLSDGYRYSGNPGESNYEVIAFDSYLQHLPVDPNVQRDAVKADARSTATLVGSRQKEDIAALHWRLSLPVLVIVVTLLAVPLSKTNPRQGRYVQMIPAILLYIIYLVSLNAARGAVEDGRVSPYLSIWAVHLGALSVALGLLLWPYWRVKVKGKRARKLAQAKIKAKAAQMSQGQGGPHA